MSEMNWTPEQLQAIDTRSGNLLVSAAAGSGKTALLTERLRRMILEDKVDCSRILVLTFTRAAAAEMRQRFKDKLYEALGQGTWGLTDKEILEQINAVTDAQISTIDAFAAAMTRRYFEAAEADPGFRVADAAELALLTDETIDEVFEELFTRAEESSDDFSNEFLELADLYGGSRSNDGLKSKVRELAIFLESVPFPDEWVKDAVEPIDAADSETFLGLPAFESFVTSIRGIIEKAVNNYKRVQTMVDEIPFGKTAKSKQTLESEIDSVLALDGLEDFGEIVKALSGLNFGRVTIPKKDLVIKETVDELRGNSTKGSNKELRDLKKNFGKYDLDLELKRAKDMNRHFKALCRLLWMVNDRLQRKKAQSRIMSFNDVERALIKILQDPKAREDIMNEYQFIFLDEYQDTNPVQEAIISQIERGDNRFMVGDVKQAIYHFRNADPGIFMDKYDSYRGTEAGELILLNRNFRSSPQVINAINAVFSQIMSRTLGEIDYDADTALIPARDEQTPTPQIHILTKMDPDMETGDLPEEAPDADEVQARFIAKRIKEIINESGPGDRIGYGDISILYRSINRRAKTIMRVLSEEGIPVIFEGESERVEAQETALFLRFLNLIDNHKQDIPLLSVMHLPIFDFSLDDEAQIRETYPWTAYFYEAAERYRDEQDDDLALRLRAFYKRLGEWRELSKHLEIDDFLWRLLLDSGFYDFAGNLSGGKERKRNLRNLLERAKNYRNTSLKGLPAFLQFVARLKKRGQNLSESSGAAQADDAVHLMSIHGSKGREFPVVFIGDLGRQFNITKKRDLLYHKDIGYGARHLEIDDGILVKNNTLMLDAVAERIKQEELSEEMRLLYVAMTRAKDRLELVGMVKNEGALEHWEGGTDPSTLLRQRSPLDWIMSSLCGQIREHEDGLMRTDDWIITLSPASAYQEGIDGQTLLPETADDEEFNRLREQIMEKLEESEAPQPNMRPIKMSVSRVKRYGIDDEEQVELTPVEPKNRKAGMDAAELGTAVHRLMQVMDYDSYKRAEDKASEVERQRKALVGKGFITSEASDNIDDSIIVDFFDSPLGGRLLEVWDKRGADVLKEMPFSCDIKPEEILGTEGLGERPIEVTGIIDCCFIEDGKWVLIDYKTDRRFSDAVWRQRLEEYTLQAELYAIALERLTGIPVGEKHLYFLTEREDYQVPNDEVA